MERIVATGHDPFECAFEHAAIGMALVGPDGGWLKVNAALCETFGYDAGELVAVGRGVIHPDDAGAGAVAVERMLSGEIKTYQAERRCLRKDGCVVWVLLHVSLVRDEAGDPLYFILQAQDVTGRKALDQRLAYLAYHDPLTGLPNRALLEERFELAVARAERDGRCLALLYLDLDDFKDVNDALGHAAGDGVLVAVAERLKGHFRSTDTVARLGGDEFCVLLEDVAGPQEATEVAARVASILRGPVTASERAIFVSASVGAAVREQGEDKSIAALLGEADARMYHAKRGRKAGEVLRAPYAS